MEIDTDQPGCRWLLIRRNHSTGELAYYRCYAPAPVPLATLVKVAGRRWTVEESFQAGKGLCGLDQHQVRTWTSWHRWTILAMLAHDFLAVLAATERSRTPALTDQIPLTCNEIQLLFNSLITSQNRNRRHCLRCHTGADNTNTTPEPATTADETAARRENHDLQLPY